MVKEFGFTHQKLSEIMTTSGITPEFVDFDHMLGQLKKHKGDAVTQTMVVFNIFNELSKEYEAYENSGIEGTRFSSLTEMQKTFYTFFHLINSRDVNNKSIVNADVRDYLTGQRTHNVLPIADQRMYGKLLREFFTSSGYQNEVYKWVSGKQGLLSNRFKEGVLASDIIDYFEIQWLGMDKYTKEYNISESEYTEKRNQLLKKLDIK
jgi:hypothetical protein